jgi:hypothetical protein
VPGHKKFDFDINETSSYRITNNGVVNSVTITSAATSLFFRLAR